MKKIIVILFVVSILLLSGCGEILKTISNSTEEEPLEASEVVIEPTLKAEEATLHQKL